MKRIITLFLLFTTLAIGCSKDEFKSAFEDSKKSWLEFKKANNNTYSYTVNTSSWVGSSTTTKILVSDGIVSGRVYHQYSTNGGTGQKTLVKTWEEDKISLKKHPEGASTLTLDQVYDLAATVWLKADKGENTIYFEANNAGMISLCGLVPKNCADDCFVGIEISKISNNLQE